MVEYVHSIKEQYGRAARAVPGGGMQINERNPSRAAWADDEFEVTPPSAMRAGMYDPAARLEDMDLEGIDAAVLFPPGRARSSPYTTPSSRSRCAVRSTEPAPSSSPTRPSGSRSSPSSR